MSPFQIQLRSEQRLLVVGFGCIGQGVLPLLLRHVDLRPEQISILTADENGRAVAAEFGVPFAIGRLTRANYRSLLEPRLSAGDFLLNLSLDVSSVALVEWCQARGVSYLDTCIEPWAGHHLNASVAVEARTNYALRESALALRSGRRSGPTAVLNHGANPGLVSHLLKQALHNLAADSGHSIRVPAQREDWARLACDMGVKAIQIAERDTQVDAERKRVGEFVNTWSVDAFAGECCQPAEMGWGSHERHFPPKGRRHQQGCRSGIYLNRPGATTRVRSWTPLGGVMEGLLISLGESIAISDYLTIGEGERPHYRPTVYYAYQPCDDTVLSLQELAARNWQLQANKRVLKRGITGGVDELGVLLMGPARGAYWYGSQLSIGQARALAPHNSATSLQVAASVLAGVVWTLENPNVGIVEPGEMDHRRILDIALPYLGPMAGVYTTWTPLEGRGRLFEEDIDTADPWQFKNFLVA